MAADGRISLAGAGRLHGATGLAGRNWRLVKFFDGEMMGKKLKLRQLRHGPVGGNNVKSHVCMSVATNVAGESKVSFIKSNARTHEQACAPVGA